MEGCRLVYRPAKDVNLSNKRMSSPQEPARQVKAEIKHNKNEDAGFGSFSLSYAWAEQS